MAKLHTPMRNIPFHRRVFPIIVIIIFFTVAPVLLFYAAGYRWNPKKGQVERNGTVIIDSQPANARITIDGRMTDYDTPVTIQDVAPGIHKFELSLDGFHGWSKSLDVYPEKVTFITDVWLWRQSQASLILPIDAAYQSLSSDGARLFLAAATPTQSVILNLTDLETTKIAFADGFAPTEDISWSDDDRHLISGASLGSGQNWLIDAYAIRQPLQLLPAEYRWSGTDLIGNDGQTQSTLHVSDYGVTRETLPFATRDQDVKAQIRSATGTADLVYVSLDQPDRGLILPPGEWRIESVSNEWAMLRHGHRWLSLEFTKNKPEYHSAEGDRLRPLAVKKQTFYLLINGTELLVWNPLSEPELIQRQSEKIVDAAWHREGSNIFFATEREIFAISLDAREKRIITKLDSFDQIKGLSFEGTRLLILGRKGDQSGVWSLEVE